MDVVSMLAGVLIF